MAADFLRGFPRVVAAFGYGSGVFSQMDNTNTRDNMLDILFVVDKSCKWHEENIENNASHYSFLRHFGPKFIGNLQDNFGANIYYNTLVPWKGRLIKYGVINKEYFLDDLLNWRSLYVSGRLHKPIMHYGCCPVFIKDALQCNLAHALRVSLLCLPDRFSDEQLFHMIANLSYSGDFRMIIGENKNKVSNIIKPNLERFRNLYYPILSKDPNVRLKGEYIEQTNNFELRYDRLKKLPENLLMKIMRSILPRSEKPLDQEIKNDALFKLALEQTRTVELTLQGTRSIVQTSSISQSLKGIITAGAFKSTIYSGRKLEKMLRSFLK